MTLIEANDRQALRWPAVATRHTICAHQAMTRCLALGTRPRIPHVFPSIPWLGLAVALASAGLAAQEREHNAWPALVQETDAHGQIQAWTAAGPLLFSHPSSGGGTVGGLRPLWVQTENGQGKRESVLVIYPLFSWSADAESYHWNVFELIRRTARRPDAPPLTSPLERDDVLEVWPFWFSQQTGDPDTSYRALFPVAGTLKGHLGYQRLSWIAFPAFVQTEQQGAVTTQTPWPFVRVTHGAAHGFALWPLFGWQKRPDISTKAFFLWPFGYHQTHQPAPGSPDDTPAAQEFGALPFYTLSTGPGYRSENYLWPFFGYTDRTESPAYHETRYFWPFLVQGRGDDRYVNRWGPFYTHSIINGYDKTWYLWPLVRHAEWTADGLRQTKNQFGIFLYWSLQQRSPTHPELAPAAVTHVWPLYSTWDDGAGHHQFEFPSPLEVFFPGNEKIRSTWTPFFSLFRYDRRASGDLRASLLWNAVTWTRDTSEDRKEFHLGPLVSYVRRPDAMDFEFAGGLFGTSRTAGRRTWRLFWFNLPSR